MAQKQPQMPFQRKTLSEEEQYEQELMEFAEENISKDFTMNVVGWFC